WESTSPGSITAFPKSWTSTPAGTWFGGTTDRIFSPSTSIAAGMILPGVTTRWETKAGKPPPTRKGQRVARKLWFFKIQHGMSNHPMIARVEALPPAPEDLTTFRGGRLYSAFREAAGDK